MIVFKSKFKRKINESVLNLFGWDNISCIGKFDKNNNLILSKTLINSFNIRIILHYENDNLKYWSINNKKHTQLYIDDFLKLCNQKYYIDFKIN